jgi:two-component system NtrC family response regulator
MRVKKEDFVALVLVIDDDRAVCDAIAVVVRQIGHEVRCASTFREGLKESRLREFALVLVDVQLPDGSGLDLLPRLREKLPCPEVIIMTGHGDPDGAELAIRNGAWDYIQKPSALENISLALTRALQYQEEKLKRAVPVPLMRDMIIGNSLPIKECLDLVALAASSNANTLICGETGTGKELFAAAIHNNSARADNNFVVIDCSALPGTLVESVLFGHEKGAYTGADRNQSGLIAQADNGTLFLDEIGELPMAIQKAFLRVIQERRYRPVGGKKEVASDFSLIAATNRNLDDMVKKGQFRNDLLHRLKTIQIVLPPLREHKDDIKALTQHYVTQFCLHHHISIKGFTPELFSVLEAYAWPGNVRELNQALERAMASAGTSPLLYPKDLPTEIRAKMARDSVHHPSSSGETTHRVKKEGKSFPRLEEVRAAAIIDTERVYLKDLMAYTGGDVAAAIDLSGLSRARFYALLKKHGIATSIRPK